MLEVQQREELSKGVWQTLYGFPMIVAICFRLTSNGATQLRDAIFKRLYGAKEKTAIVLQLYGGTNYFSWKTRIFEASVIHCRIDLLTYWFTVVSSISVKNEELPMSNVLQFYRMTYKTYDMQEYIFVHPEERFTSKPFFGIFRSILSRKATSSTLISNLLTLPVQTSPFCVGLCFAFWFSALTFATLILSTHKG